jgi:flagellar hook protein FlgE
VTVFDSQGNAHNMNLFYVKDANNKWDLYAQDGSVAGSTAALATTLTFDNNGTLTGGGNINITTGTIRVRRRRPSPELPELHAAEHRCEQRRGDHQNGYKPGDLVSYQINDDGTVVGNYSNEQTQVLGQIVLANFANNEGLKSEGDNVWSATQSSGVALLGTAGTGNFGTLTNGALEASNVDLSKELVNMIVAQRNYQSNAQTIKTQDQILNTLVNLR